LILAAALFTLTTGTAVADTELDADTVALADSVGLDPVALAGALHSQPGVDAHAYLRFLGVLTSDAVASASGSPPLSGRVACIEEKESGGANVANLHGSGAVGVMQYMPGTFYAHAAELGHADWSPWNPAQARAVAAHDLVMGRRSQWTVGGC
jgi:hypothetical protein